MSTRVDTASLISGATVCGHRGHGVLGSTILLTTGSGAHGPGVLYNDVQAGDEGKEFRAYVAAPPAGLRMDEDGTFVYDGPPTSFDYRLFVDGVDLGVATVTTTEVADVPLAGAAQLRFSAAADITVGAVPAAVTLAAAAGVRFTAAANVTVGAAPAAVTLAGTATVQFAASADITVDAVGSVQLAGGAQLVFTASADIAVGATTAAVELAGAAGVSFLGSADIAVGAAPEPAVELAAAAACFVAATAAITVGAANPGGVPGWVFSSELRTVTVFSDATGVLGKFVKQPREVLDYRFDFTPWLSDCSDAIAGFAVASSDAALAAPTLGQKDGSVAAFVSGGVNGQTYKLTCTVTTAGGRTKEADIQIRIKEV